MKTQIFRTAITILCIAIFSVTLNAQNTSPLKVLEFRNIPNGIMDEGKIDRNHLTDYDSNPVCEIIVKAQGFDESTLQKLIFVPRNVMIMQKDYDNGQYRLYASSKKLGSIVIKYQGDCEWVLPYELKPKAIYELTLGMETATLNIISTPDNATIYIDNERIGMGYASKAVSIGAEHHYKVECENYITEENSILFTRSEKKEIDVELRPNFGYITIGSTPSGAEIYIDEKKVGNTPYQGKKIKRGQHIIEVRMTGYNSKVEMISIKPGDLNTQLQNIELQAIKVATGTLVLESNPTGAVITINGRQYGQTPKTLTGIAVGKYTIYFTKDGYQNLSQVIDLKDGKTENVSVTMSKTAVAQPTVAAGTSANSNSSGSYSNGSLSTNGHEYVNLGLPSGTLWATCNVGASKPEEYGDYYAWGEIMTKSVFDWNTYKWCLGSYDSQTKYCTSSSYGIVDYRKVLDMLDDAARANWGGSWRMPTNDELNELKNKCDWQWTSQDGMKGYHVIGPNGNSIFLPVAGFYNEDNHNLGGSSGYYWSKSLYTLSSSQAHYLYFGSSYINMYSNYRNYGMSVRPVCSPQK